MVDEQDMNRVVTHILTLRDQVLRWAAPIKHNDSTDGEKYGQADETHFGHVVVKGDITQAGDNPVKGSAIYQYLQNYLQNKLNIKEVIDDNATHESNQKKNVPTTKAVLDKINEILNERLANYQTKLNIINDAITSGDNDENDIPNANSVWKTLTSYKNLLVGVSLEMPRSYKGSINNLVTPGYYIMDHDKNNPKYFSYGGQKIYYTNALVTVEKQSNRVIQHVCATQKVTSSSNKNNFNYKINGTEYRRHGSYTSDEKKWKPWHAFHIPYRQTARVHTLGRDVDNNSVTVYENTQGFIIRWKQTNNNQQRYPIHAPLYEYATVCTFEPALPINGPYVFGNLIGRMDIRITSTKMEIRSNVSPGGRIIGMDETYFVPRNQ